MEKEELLKKAIEFVSKENKLILERYNEIKKEYLCRLHIVP